MAMLIPMGLIFATLFIAISLVGMVSPEKSEANAGKSDPRRA